MAAWGLIVAVLLVLGVRWPLFLLGLARW